MQELIKFTVVENHCKQSDLRAVTSTPAYWYVGDDGSAEDFAFNGDMDCSPDAEEWTCLECGEDFTAWQDALAHLNPGVCECARGAA